MVKLTVFFFALFLALSLTISANNASLSQAYAHEGDNPPPSNPPPL
jgi:preprotein translocase subunit SecG